MIPANLQWIADELENWARWGRQADGPHGVPEPSIWDAWLNFKGRIAGWGLSLAEQAAEARGEDVIVAEGEDPLPEIDERLAETADRKMRYLRDCNARVYGPLRRHFYQRRPVTWERLHEAMRRYGELS